MLVPAVTQECRLGLRVLEEPPEQQPLVGRHVVVAGPGEPRDGRAAAVGADDQAGQQLGLVAVLANAHSRETTAVLDQPDHLRAGMHLGARLAGCLGEDRIQQRPAHRGDAAGVAGQARKLDRQLDIFDARIGAHHHRGARRAQPLDHAEAVQERQGVGLEQVTERVSLGKLARSSTVTRTPSRASSAASGEPAQRAPTTITSACSLMGRRRWLRSARSPHYPSCSTYLMTTRYMQGSYLVHVRLSSAQTKQRPRKRLSASERRELIEAAASELFAQRGYTATSIDEIARRSGVTAPVVYDDFASKLELHRRLLERHYAELRQLWREQLAGTDPPAQRIPGAIDAWFAYVEAHPYAWRMLFRDTTGEPAVQAAHAEVIAQSRAAITPLFLAQPGVGELVGADSDGLDMAWEVMRAVLQGLALWWYEHQHVTRAQVVATAMNALWIGFERLQRAKAGRAATRPQGSV